MHNPHLRPPSRESYRWGIVVTADGNDLAYATLVTAADKEEAFAIATCEFESRGLTRIVPEIVQNFGNGNPSTTARVLGIFKTEVQTLNAIWIKTIPRRALVT